MVFSLGYRKAGGLREITPKHWMPGLAFVGSALCLWLIGRATDINLIAQAGAVG